MLPQSNFSSVISASSAQSAFPTGASSWPLLSMASCLCTAQLQAVQRPDEADVLAGDVVTNEIGLMFVSPDHGVLMQEYQSLDAAGGQGDPCAHVCMHALELRALCMCGLVS